MATDYLSQVVPVNETTRKMTPEEEAALLAATQGGQAQEPMQPEQGGGMVAPYYSGPAPTGMGSDPKARLAAVFGAMKGAQSATDTGGGAAEIMAAIDEFPALSGYLKYGRTFGKSSDQSTDSWARSMGAAAGPMINALVQSQANRSQNEVAGANQRMSLLDGAVSRLAEEPRPQMAAQNPRDYHANTMLQSADATLDRIGKQMLMLEENSGLRGASSWGDDQWNAAIKKNPAMTGVRDSMMRMRAEEQAARQLKQSSLGRLMGNVVGIGGGQNMQAPVNGRPNAASRGAAMISDGLPPTAKKMATAKLGGGGPMAPAAGGGVLSPQAPARQGGGPTIWPASRFRPPVPPAQALPPITLGESDFKTGAVPMPAQAGGAVQPVATGGVKPPQSPSWAGMANINRPMPEASAFPERPTLPARPSVPISAALKGLAEFGSIGKLAQTAQRQQQANPLSMIQQFLQKQQAEQAAQEAERQKLLEAQAMQKNATQRATMPVPSAKLGVF